MKQSDFDSQFQKFNQINLTKQESSESYHQVLNKYRTANIRKKKGIIFNHFFSGFATIALVVVVGWFLSDLLIPSMNQPGDKVPSVVDEDIEDENLDTEPKLEDESEAIMDDKTYACLDSHVNPTPDSVLVYFECNNTEDQSSPLKAVQRDLETDNVGSRIEYAILQTIKGPTKEERENGFSSEFNESTTGMLNGIALQESGHLIVDFVDFSTVIPNANSSAASHSLLTTLNTTISQFKVVETIEYRFDGSCEHFYAWLQMVCTVYDADDYRIGEEELDNEFDEFIQKDENFPIISKLVEEFVIAHTTGDKETLEQLLSSEIELMEKDNRLYVTDKRNGVEWFLYYPNRGITFEKWIMQGYAYDDQEGVYYVHIREFYVDENGETLSPPTFLNLKFMLLGPDWKIVDLEFDV